jgi:PKD repeat protein
MRYWQLVLFIYFFKINGFFSQVNASFSSDVVVGCSPLVVNFNNTSSNSISYFWDFNNGSTSILNNPSATFINPGFYSIKLVAIGATGSDSIVSTDYIHVLDKPTASLSYNILSNCENNNFIDFTNTSIGATSNIWDFGNGDTTNSVNPTYSFPMSGNFPVTLVVSNIFGCSDDTTVGPLVIEPSPILNAVIDSNLVCDSTYNFTLSGSSSNSVISNWQWFFGDGTDATSSNSNIQYSYNSTGIFTPKVVATTINGCIDSINLDTIIINAKENYSFTSDVQSGCPPLNVNFTIAPSNNIQNIIWNFDDGNIISGNESANNQYINSGVYHPIATVESNNGCVQDVLFPNSINLSTPPIGTFSMSNYSGCPPLDVQFNVFTSAFNNVLISFGDGQYSSSNSINHIYYDNGAFNPILTIIDSNNCQNSINMDTVLIGAGDIDFTASVNDGCASLKVNFTSNSNADTYYWDFGDSTYSNDENPEHTYDFEGSYTVSFYANDTNSCIDTLVKDDYILVRKEEVDLFTMDTIIACSPFVFNTDVYNIGVNFWNWDFGDGNLDSGSNISHTYTESGTYNISLFTDAPNGCSYDINNFALLQIDNLVVDANVVSDCNNGNVNITNNSTGVIQHQWNMGDGTIYNTPNVTHNYDTSQSYIITYESISDFGCSKFEYYSAVFDCNYPNPVIIQMPQQNPINPIIDTINNIPINQVCGFRNVNMNSPFLTAIAWEWDFGDGQNSNEKNPSHFYDTTGIFDVIHVAHYANGNTDTLIINNFIDQYNLDPSFTLNKNEFCNYNTYTFNNNSSFATSWEWSLDSNVISNNSFDSLTLQLNDSISLLNLRITDQYGCESESQQNIFLYHPLALIEQDSFACFGETINMVCSVKDQPIHTWDMKDSTFLSPDTAIFHNYQQSGWFAPTLLLDNMGCVREVQLDSVLILEPDASFTPIFINPICKKDSIFFKANNTTYSNYNWSGGTSSSSSDSAWIIMNIAGNHRISLNVTDRGCSNSFSSDSILVNEAKADFNYTLLNFCNPIDILFQDSSVNPVSWDWNFDSVLSSNSQNIIQQFQNFPDDSIQLNITDVNGCSDSVYKKLVNNFNSNFTASDTIICFGTSITFTPESEVVSTFQWEFGDGNVSFDSISSHFYQSPGFYDVKLIVSDGQGCTDTTILYNYIEVKKVNADFSYSSNGTCPPIITSFTNLSSGASNYYWDFGDNLNSNIQNPAHTYSVGGYYDISLISSDNFGCTDTLEISNLVYIPGPVLDFNINQFFGCDSLTISITDNSINTTSYLYNFGDGATSTLQNPVYTYYNPGSYQISLVGEDSAGCQVGFNSSEIITVDVSPNAIFQLYDTNYCFGDSFSINNNSIFASNHQWIYGSLIDNSISPTILVDLVGINQLEYIAGNSNNTCFDTSITNIIGHFIPHVSIVDPGVLCSNQGIVNFNSLNSSAYNELSWSGTGIIDSSLGTFNPLLINDSSLIYLNHDSICTSMDSIIVLVDQPIDATVLTNDTNYCENSSILSPNVLNSGGFWIGQSVDSLTGLITNNLSPSFYSYQYITLNNNNCRDTGSYQIQIIANKDASILNPGIICDNDDTIILNTLELGGIWSGSLIDSLTGLIDVGILGNGVYEFIYTINGICPDEDTLNLEIFEFVQADINSSTEFCQGLDSIQFSASSSIGYWTGLPYSDSLSGWFISDTLGVGIYDIYYTIDGNCPSKDTMSFEIHPRPEINISLSQNLPCLGYQLNVNNLSNNLPNEDFAWYIDDSLYYQNFNEPYFFLDTGFYNIKVIAINQFNCISELVLQDSLPIYDTTRLSNPEVIRSTVVDNENIYTEWLSNGLILNPLSQHLLYRSVNGNDFELIATLDSSIKSYLDEFVDVNSNQYDYLVINKNLCNVNSINSNYGNSILFESNRLDNFRTKLNWNFYNGWINNPNRYEIQKLNSSGNWEIINILENTENEIIINE